MKDVKWVIQDQLETQALQDILDILDILDTLETQDIRDLYRIPDQRVAHNLKNIFFGESRYFHFTRIK